MQLADLVLLRSHLITCETFGTFEQSLLYQIASTSFSEATASVLVESEGGGSAMIHGKTRTTYFYMEQVEFATGRNRGDTESSQ